MNQKIRSLDDLKNVIAELNDSGIQYTVQFPRHAFYTVVNNPRLNIVKITDSDVSITQYDICWEGYASNTWNSYSLFCDIKGYLLNTKNNDTPVYDDSGIITAITGTEKSTIIARDCAEYIDRGISLAEYYDFISMNSITPENGWRVACVRSENNICLLRMVLDYPNLNIRLLVTVVTKEMMSHAVLAFGTAAYEDVKFEITMMREDADAKLKYAKLLESMLQDLTPEAELAIEASDIEKENYE